MNFKLRSKCIKDLIAKHNIINFVETGTYLCYMIIEMLPNVKHIWTVELNDKLYEDAVAKFGTDPKVTLVHGDSGDKLGEMLIDTQDCAHTLVFLDAHFSGGLTTRGIDDSPISRELTHVIDHKPKVVVIDDRHGFGKLGWPSEEAVKERLTAAGYECSIFDNILIAILSS